MLAEGMDDEPGRLRHRPGGRRAFEERTIAKVARHKVPAACGVLRFASGLRSRLRGRVRERFDARLLAA